MSAVIYDSGVLRSGWEKAKANLGFFILAIFVSIIAALIPLGFMIGAATDLQSLTWLYWLAYVAYYVVVLVLSMGWIAISVTFAKGKKAELLDLVRPWKRFFPFLGVVILVSIVVYIGIFLLVFPAVIWGLKFMFAPYLVVDQKMGPIEAMKKSSAMTNGVKWDLLGFGFTTMCVNLLGCMALGLGLFVTIPATHIAQAEIYQTLLKRAK
jgi:uncharacterized membrane protein